MKASGYEIKVIYSLQDHIRLLESKNWWGESARENNLVAPRMVISGITSTWGQQANELPVATKKEIFYRYAVPLALFANELVLAQRERLFMVDNQLLFFDSVRDIDREWVGLLTDEYKVPGKSRYWVATASAHDMRSLVEELKLRVDAIPVGLVLGQAAYESGYGTSRFAVEGNALFGQWTFNGKGMVPLQQRTTQLGDHRIATFDWPFESFRGYFNNLNTHPAYLSFRLLRAEQRRNNEPLSSLALADGLDKYSERGNDYVASLKSTIRVNKLDVADKAVLAPGEITFVFGQEDKQKAEVLEQELQQMAADGRLEHLEKRMRMGMLRTVSL